MPQPEIVKTQLEIIKGQTNGHRKTETETTMFLFTVQPINNWMTAAAKRPVPKMLFGELWFEGEICILFADTNVGKSILAVQIGDSISRGVQLGYFKMEAEPQTVIYFDFELSDKQFEMRYAEREDDYYKNHFEFSENFIRAEINPDSDMPAAFTDFESYLNFSLEQVIADTKTKVIIIDNITYLRSETERAKDALPLMKHLKHLKRKYNLSILVLAHTPKRDATRPLTRNDLQGSKMLINFCDSSFAIGESQKDSGFRYIKQIKVRNTEFVYGEDSVCVCQISKPSNFLKFEFLETQLEHEHLKTISQNDKDELVARVKELKNSGKTIRDISAELGISTGAVHKYLKR